MKLAIRGTRLFIDIEGAEWRWRHGTLAHFPPLLMLHGGPGANHTRLKRELSWLSEWHQLVFIDQRGCGFSDPCPRRALTLDNNVKDIEAVRAACGWERIGLLGWSYGGMLAIEYAARHADRLSSLILLSTAGSGDFMRSSQAFVARHGTPAQIRMAEATQRGVFRSAAHLARYSRVMASLAAVRAAKPGCGPFNLDACNQGFRSDLPSWNALPHLQKVRAPVFIGVGRRDYICPVDQSEALKRALPRATFRIYEKSSHFPSCDEPRRFRKDLTTFVRKWAGHED